MKIDYTRYYRRWHSDDPIHAQRLASHYARLLGPYLPQDKGAKILDIGCGMGFALLTLRSLGFDNLQGIEADEGQVKSCLSRGIPVVLSADTEATLKSDAQRYELVLLLDVLEHVPVTKQLSLLTTINQVLSPGGMIICTVPNANSSMASRWRYNDWTHQISFTECSLDFVLYNAGFGEINISEYDFISRPRFWWLPVRGRLNYWRFRFFRYLRRMEAIAELGKEHGSRIPLSLNLIATARARQ